ncbi:MAG TPA: transaldolase family protein [Bacteroidales bacterium]|nr:transaldolase family protein [Bacteroidales bacterium]
MNSIKLTLNTLLASYDQREGLAAVIADEKKYVDRVLNTQLTADQYNFFKSTVKYIGVTSNFREVVDYFKTPEDQTPAGFRHELVLEGNNVLRVDLVRNITYDKNGLKRPTKVLFSADSANPYEVEPISDMIANLTCNPGIIYDLFINNPKANIGNKYKTRDEVMQEIGRILGPGCDISVELNNPFSDSMNEILEEAAKFKEMLSKYRVVIKVPHTGPVNRQNVNQLLQGDKKFSLPYDGGTTKDKFHGHNLAYKLQEHGYRINFTLMFDPYQTALALQAKPYFINSFVRHRLVASQSIKALLASNSIDELKKFFIEKDYLPPTSEMSATDLKKMAERILRYRKFDDTEGIDGLDSVRHSLRVLRNANLPDTRLIVCSMEGEENYPDLDKLLAEPEFIDMADRVVITAEPQYLAKFTTSPLVVSYQRRFMNAANGQK